MIYCLPETAAGVLCLLIKTRHKAALNTSDTYWFDDIMHTTHLYPFDDLHTCDTYSYWFDDIMHTTYLYPFDDLHTCDTYSHWFI